MPVRRRSLLILTVLLILLLTLFAGVMTSTNAQDEKVLVVGWSEITDSLDPANGYTQTTSVVHKAVYQGLVTFPSGDASSIEPSLATSWEISDDGLVYTFTLGDAVFSNGDPVTADDVVYSFERLQNLGGNPSFLADGIASVEAVDDKTVAITLTEVTPGFLATLTNNPFSITNSKVVMENGGTSDPATDTAEDWLNQNSAGTGPYIIDHWDSQVETVLVRNDNYQGDPPYFDRIIFVNMPEAATQAVSLESGEIDLAIDLTADQVSGLEDNPDISVYRSPGNYTHFLLMNMDPDLGGPVSDPNVQRAIRYALDYEGYRTLWPGSVTPATMMWMGIQGAFQPDQAIQRDLDKARQLLADAGYPDGFDITMSYPDLVFGGVDSNVNAQKIQADLAEVGINVELRPGEVQVSLEEYRNGQQGFAYWFWGPDILDPSDLLSFVPGGKVAAERANWTADMASPDLAALVDRAKVATNPAERQGIYAAIQTDLQENGIWAPFSLPPVQFAYSSDIQGFVWHPQWQFDPTLLSRAE